MVPARDELNAMKARLAYRTADITTLLRYFREGLTSDLGSYYLAFLAGLPFFGDEA